MAAPMILMRIIDSGAMANAANLVKGAVRANRDTQKKAARIFIIINLINKKSQEFRTLKWTIPVTKYYRCSRLAPETTVI